VPDLMAALEASLAEAGKSNGRAKPRPKAKSKPKPRAKAKSSR
jgi:hypothetical protein